MSRGVRLLDHTADFGIEIRGEDPADLFARAAKGLFSLIADPVLPGATRSSRIQIEGQDWPDLLVNWLRELLYLWSGEQRLLCDVTIETIAETRMTAMVDTMAYSPRHHRIRNEIKAVTYHQAEVSRGDIGWVAKIYMDV